MNANFLGTVALTVALLAIGVGAGVSLMPEPVPEVDAQPDEPPASRARLDQLEDSILELQRAVDGLEGELEPTKRVATLMAALETHAPFKDALMNARLRANETAAIATLRNIISAQAQFQQSGKADMDDDGTGEYGGFAELSGARRGRLAGLLSPPVLSGTFRVLDANGGVSRSGYVFRIYLPSPEGRGVGEPQHGFRGERTDADLAETTWCCYAWPVKYGVTGRRSFFTNQGGDVIATDHPGYSGIGAPIPSDAAFQVEGSICGSVAIGVRGIDGKVWVQVQ